MTLLNGQVTSNYGMKRSRIESPGGHSSPERSPEIFMSCRWSKAGRPSRLDLELPADLLGTTTLTPVLSKYLPNWQILGFYISEKEINKTLATTTSSKTKVSPCFFLVPSGSWELNPSEQQQQLTTSPTQKLAKKMHLFSLEANSQPGFCFGKVGSGGLVWCHFRALVVFFVSLSKIEVIYRP